MSEPDARDINRGHMSVGYVGLGAMGGALARRLLLSRPLTVFDPDRETVESLVRDGATAAPDPVALARECDVIMICVPTSAIVRAALFAPGGLSEGLAPGALVVDQTTGDPSATQAIAVELAERGVTMLDAPVSGGPRGAVAGTIGIFCGGPQEAYERIRPIFDDISPNSVYTGAVGTGHAGKLIQNAVAACNRVLTTECVAAACKSGLPLNVMPEAINRSSGWSGLAERVIPALGTETATSNFQMSLMVKDLRLATTMGRDFGAPMLVANVVCGLFQTCLNEGGPDQNLDDIARLIERSAGVIFGDHTGGSV